jgi:catechol 2,3-dioxygenase-like lactoylglutathione lyase family enzyme
MKLRTGEPFMPADKYGRTLAGLTVNLLVRSVEDAVRFEREVLGAEVVYADPDFAVMRGYGSEWMLHADHTYEDHPLRQRIEGDSLRGSGIELRVHGCDPDAAVQKARALGFAVMKDPIEKGHGLREAHIVDADGYVWVADVPRK